MKSNHPQFPALVLFPDEALFNPEGIFNTRIEHVLSESNPHVTDVLKDRDDLL